MQFYSARVTFRVHFTDPTRELTENIKHCANNDSKIHPDN